MSGQRDIEVRRLDQALQGMRRVVLRPPGMSLPIPALGRSVDLSKILACEAIADLSAEGEATITDVAHALQLERSTTSRLVGEAEEEGLVTRAAHPEDRRRVLVEVTPLGRDVIAFTHGLREAYLGHATEVFSDDELRDLVRLLGKLSDSLATTLAGWLAAQAAPPPPSRGGQSSAEDSSAMTERATEEAMETS